MIRVIGSAIMFLVLAGGSCWATEKSLHMLLPAGWPEIIVWGITIAFFIIASIGSKMIVDSLMSQSFIDNRKGKLIGGIVLVVAFWLCFSMPTNTHTFFFNDNIGSVISEDIETTNNYLQQIVDKGPGSATLVLDPKGKELKDSIDNIIVHIDAQFYGDEYPYKSGNGPIIGEYIKRVNTLLNSQITQNSNRYSKDPTILNEYRVNIRKALNHALKTHTISTQSVKDARDTRNKLSALKDSIQDHIATGSLSVAEIRQCEAVLGKGYEIIKTNSNFIQFDEEKNHKVLYTQVKIQTKTKRMMSVIDVGADFLSGKYSKSFWYYILLSILVDIGAFIFFDTMLIKKQ